MSPSAAPSAPNAPRASASAERRLVMMEALAELSMQVAQLCGREALEAAAGVSAARGVHGAAQAEARAASPEVASEVTSEVASTALTETVDEAAASAFTPEFNPVVVAETKAAASAAALAVASLAAAHGEAMLAFSRAARAAQMSVALWERLERRQAQGAAAEARAAVEARRAETLDRRARAERLVARIAEDHFEDALPGEDNDAAAEAAAGFALAEARVRLGDEDLYGDLPDHPFSEIVARICRDVGLDPDWSRLGEEDWAQAEVAADPAGPLGPTVGRPLRGSLGLQALGRRLKGDGAPPPWRDRRCPPSPSPRRRRRFEARQAEAARAKAALEEQALARVQGRGAGFGHGYGGSGRVPRQGRSNFEARPPPLTNLKVVFVDGNADVSGKKTEPPPDAAAALPPHPSPPHPPPRDPRLRVEF